MTSGTTSGIGADGVGPTVRTVGDLLRSAAARFGQRSALITAAGTRSWAELDRAADAGAGALIGAGLTPGSRVVVSLETGPDIVAALFAVARAGLVAVPIGPGRADLSEIVARVTAAGAIAGQQSVPVPVLLRPEDVADWWTAAAPTAAAPMAVAPMAAAPPDQPSTEKPAVEVEPEDLAVLARAASSDRPVMVSHRAVVAAVTAIAATPRLALRADDRAVVVLPIYHLAGWVTAFLPLTLVGAAAVIPSPPEGAHSWLDTVLTAIREHRVTLVPGAPGLYRRLRTASGVERALASVRLMTSGAAPLDPGDFSAIKALTGQAVWEGYGVSESASVVSTSLMTTASRRGSVGRPLTGMGLRIIGDDGEDLYGESATATSAADDPADLAADTGSGGEVGRIQISGPTLFSGYWPDGTGGPAADGWFATGDLGYLDERGELHLVDRAAETIRVAGFTVYPREIEGVLMQHPYVRDAAVIAVPGPAGDGFAAVLVPLWGTRPTRSDLDEFLADRLPAFKRPRHFQLVDRLPRNEIGRIDRDAVRALYREREQLAADRSDDGPGRESAEQSARVLAGAGGSGRADSGRPTDGSRPTVGTPDGEPTSAEKPAVVEPEPAAGLDELGTRLPGTGERAVRGDQDTDDDLF